MVVLVLALAGCQGSEEAPRAAREPEPVAPVEVTTPPGEAPDEVAQLQARVAELEQQLAACRGQTAPSGTQAAPVPAVIPQGVDLPGQPSEPSAHPSTPPSTQPSTTHEIDAGTRARRRPPSLIEQVLGDDAPRHRRDGDDDVIELPDPTRLLAP